MTIGDSEVHSYAEIGKELTIIQPNVRILNKDFKMEHLLSFAMVSRINISKARAYVLFTMLP